LTRTVEDLYAWNKNKVQNIQSKKKESEQNIVQLKQFMCPGSIDILSSKEDLHEKCVNKINSIRNMVTQKSDNKDRVPFG
jgi:hypothetical protein